MKPPAGSRVRPDHPRIEHEGFRDEAEREAWYAGIAAYEARTKRKTKAGKGGG